MLSNSHLQDLAKLHHFPPVGHPASYADGGPLVMERGEGCWLIDAEGNRYLDGIAGLASVPIGYSNSVVAKAAADQLAILPYYHSFFHMGNAPSARLAAKLAEITPDGVEHFFFASSGSEAVESAIKIAWAYWLARGESGKRTIISRDFGYHGNTIFATSITGIGHYHAGFGIDADVSHRIPAPYRHHYAPQLSHSDFAEKAAQSLEEKIEELGAGNVAAFIGEPVQGTGGVIYPGEDYWQRIRTICDRHDILLIADEVMTGFGRLGEWFGQSHFGFTADLMTMSKGLTSSYLPMSAVGVGDKVYRTIAEHGDSFVHGFTSSAHPTCAALACANLDEIERMGLVARVRTEIGPYFEDLLASQISSLDAVAEVRGAGLMWGVELKTERFAGHPDLDPHDLAAPIVETLLQDGIIVRNSAATVMLSPPLILSEEEASMLVSQLASAIEKFDHTYRQWAEK